MIMVLENIYVFIHKATHKEVQEVNYNKDPSHRSLDKYNI